MERAQVTMSIKKERKQQIWIKKDQLRLSDKKKKNTGFKKNVLRP